MGALRRPRHGGAWEDGLVISPYKCGLRGLQSWDAEIEPRHTQPTPTKHHNKTSLRATPHHPPRPTSTPTPMPRSLHYPHLTTPHPTTRLTATHQLNTPTHLPPPIPPSTPHFIPNEHLPQLFLVQYHPSCPPLNTRHLRIPSNFTVSQTTLGSAWPSSTNSQYRPQHTNRPQLHQPPTPPSMQHQPPLNCSPPPSTALSTRLPTSTAPPTISKLSPNSSDFHHHS